ncbi:MAG: BACON domain-containing protein [Alistipes sp.]|nr:BACON domain-containing protein [Alistipes sp.]
MKSLRIIFASLAAMLTLAACQKPQNDVDDPQPTDSATLSIDDNYVQVKAEGGDYYFTYTLENPDGSELKAEAQDEWIHSFDLTSDGEVSFVVEPNTTGSQRISKITLKYGKLEDSIVITQSGEIVEVEITIDFKFDINGPYVKMHTTPTPENIRYYAWFYSVENMESALSKSPGVTEEMYLEKLIEVDLSNAIYYGQYAGYTPEEAVAELTLVGPATQEFELNGNTEFYAFGCGVTDKGEIISNVVYTTFKTGPVEPSDNVLTLSNLKVNTDRVSYDINATNMDQYATIVYPAAEVENLTDEELIAKFNKIEGITSYLNFGSCSKEYLLHEQDTDYYVYYFGYEYGMATTEIKREKIHTEAYDANIAPEFEISIDKLTHYRVKASIDVSPETSLYYIDVCGVNESAEELKETVREAAQWYVDNGYYDNISMCYRIVGSKGSKQVEFTGLYPETEYRVYAFGIDEKTGEFNSDVVFSEVIKTPKQKISESYITIATDKYFDGFDVVERYPVEFSDADGWAVLPLEVEIHGDVVDYYYDVYVGDVTDTTFPTDNEIILDLVQYGKMNEPITYSYCYFYEPLTLIYFSKDSDDNNSAVTRVPLYLDPENCADISEFPFNSSATAAFKAERKFVK